MEKKEIQAVYFKLYDELPEPYRTQAKENWSYDNSMFKLPPESYIEAIMFGFVWKNTPKGQGINYWNNAYKGDFTSLQQNLTQKVSELAKELAIAGYGNAAVKLHEVSNGMKEEGNHYSVIEKKEKDGSN